MCVVHNNNSSELHKTIILFLFYSTAFTTGASSGASTSSSSMGVIIGVVVAVILLVALAIGAFCIYKKMKGKSKVNGDIEKKQVPPQGMLYIGDYFALYFLIIKTILFLLIICCKCIVLTFLPKPYILLNTPFVRVFVPGVLFVRVFVPGVLFVRVFVLGVLFVRVFVLGVLFVRVFVPGVLFVRVFVPGVLFAYLFFPLNSVYDKQQLV